jgi:hypothetical protein
MDGESYLYALVEAGVALAGFSAIAAILGVKDPHESGTTQRLVVARLVERSLMASLFALLPILLFGLGLSGRIVWLISSGTLAIYGAITLTRTLQRRAIAHQLGLSRSLFILLVLIALAIIIVQVLNAIGVVLAQGLWWYTLGVTWLMVSAGYTFVIYLRAWVRAT